MSLLKFSLNKNLYVIIGLLLLSIGATSALFHGDTTLVSSSTRLFFVLIQYLSILIALVFTSYRNVSRKSMLILIPVLVYFLISTYNIPDNYNQSLNLLFIFPLILFSLQPSNVILSLYKFYYRFLVIVSILGIFACICFVLGLNVPYEVVEYYSGENYYVNYYFAYLYWGGAEGAMFRLCGLFNEPGYLGTISALILVIEEYNLKKFSNVLIFISGFLSLSAAFFFIFFIYIFLKSYKKVSLYIFIFSLGLSVAISFNYIKNNFPSLASLIERFEYDSEEGKFKADNRSNKNFDRAYEELFSSYNKILLGNGTNSHFMIRNQNSESYKTIIYQYGLLGFLLIYFSFFIIRINDILKYKRTIFFTLLFIISIYQRPRIFLITYFVIFYGGLEYIIQEERLKLNIKEDVKS